MPQNVSSIELGLGNSMEQSFSINFTKTRPISLSIKANFYLHKKPTCYLICKEYFFNKTAKVYNIEPSPLPAKSV